MRFGVRAGIRLGGRKRREKLQGVEESIKGVSGLQLGAGRGVVSKEGEGVKWKDDQEARPLC